MARGWWLMLGVSLFAVGGELVGTVQVAQAQEHAQARDLVQRAIEHWRGQSSRTHSTMTIHRPSWQRTSELQVFTSGRKRSLVRFIAPAKDAGNASLTIQDEIWTFSPKLNRVMKIPPSMKSQSWMGSDFSYDDLSKTDDIIDQYTHRITRRFTEGAFSFTEVESIPRESAPIVWGREVLVIRSDLVIVKHEFYDQGQKLVKALQAVEIKELDGRAYATKIRMQNVEKVDEWTEVVTAEAKFDTPLPDYLFTLSNLSSPRGEPPA